ncbi:DUF2459 domain-containing protein [Oceanimonas doudoroffii]|uniref:TIGR02117 family protein n=1 Tax=Oceanimonas doudoroffii TaxID=84158 RepID=A0A233RDF3_9GAMM|nr:DUF2459 domain-containing protein [Oceanimonas doudoroffii]OXY81415.1 hypothetical protein B6S08_13100 [Oceanimonas doudoroffii]
MHLWLVLLLALLCTGCGAASEWRPAKERGQDLYLVDHGRHVGLVLPAVGLQRHLSELKAAFPAARLIEVGWGDRAFYQHERAGAGLALRALLWPTDTVLHLVPLSQSPAVAFAGLPVLELSVPPAGMERLLGEVAASFARNEAGNLRDVGAGRYGGGRFYASVESYHLLHTCNTWVARRLVAAGLPLRPALAFTAGALMRQARSAKGEYAQGYSSHN